jgi:hypothetical protein
MLSTVQDMQKISSALKSYQNYACEAVLRIGCIDYADPDPSFYLKADPDPNPQSQTNSDPCDPDLNSGQTLKSQKVEKYTWRSMVGNRLTNIPTKAQ